MIMYLVQKGADVNLEDNEGHTAMDISVMRMNYEPARFLKKCGLEPKPKEFYDTKMWLKFDIELFF